MKLSVVFVSAVLAFAGVPGSLAGPVLVSVRIPLAPKQAKLTTVAARRHCFRVRDPVDVICLLYAYLL